MTENNVISPSPVVSPSPVMNWGDVTGKVEADSRGKWDMPIAPSALRMHHGRLGYEDHLYWEELDLTPWATTQLCQRLRMPTAYFRRCPTPLQDAQVNHWLQARTSADVDEAVEENEWPVRDETDTTERRWLLRCKHGTLRAILSERYACFDHPALLEAMAGTVNGRFQVNWCALSEDSLHVRLLDPTLTREALPGDRLMAGLHIANSEVGKRAVTVDALVYRLVCQNGLVRLVKGKSLLYQKHVALSADRFQTELSEAVGEALMQSAGFMERLVMATRTPVSDVDKTLLTLGQRWSLPQVMQESIRDGLLGSPAGQQETLYGLVNAVTRAAQTLNADDRHALETLAGTLLDESHGELVLAASNGKKPTKETALPVSAVASRPREVAPSSTPLPVFASLFGEDFDGATNGHGRSHP